MTTRELRTTVQKQSGHSQEKKNIYSVSNVRPQVPSYTKMMKIYLELRQYFYTFQNIGVHFARKKIEKR